MMKILLTGVLHEVFPIKEVLFFLEMLYVFVFALVQLMRWYDERVEGTTEVGVH